MYTYTEKNEQKLKINKKEQFKSKFFFDFVVQATNCTFFLF